MHAFRAYPLMAPTRPESRRAQNTLCDDLYAILGVIPGQGAAFEAACREASAIIALIDGYLSHELRRCIERPARCPLLVHWQTLEDHTVGFGRSPRYDEWKRLLHYFYDPFPTVEHYNRISLPRRATT